MSSSRRINSIIVAELKNVIKKYGEERRTAIVYEDDIQSFDEEEHIDDYTVNVFMSREGYLKKITPQSLRMSSEQKYKDSDGAYIAFESTNKSELLVFTDKQQVYKARLRDFEDSKASNLGLFLPTELQMDDGENVIYIIDPSDYSSHVMFFFANGKVARVELASYATKTNRKKLTGAYSDKSEVKAVLPLKEDQELAIIATDGRAVIFNTALLSPKTSRSTQGVQVMSLKRNQSVVAAVPLELAQISDPARYRVRTIPAAGAILKPEDRGEEQLTMLE